jgi:thiamine-monophosphate kinase
VGGNLSRGATFAITLTVIGVAHPPVSRTGAQVGDLVMVTGTLGGPGAALAAWQQGDTPTAWARDRFAAPTPRLAEGEWLARMGASAMLDISDGLAADARHLGAASGVVVSLDPARLPVGTGLTPAQALRSGEEYELLVTVPPGRLAAVTGGWSAFSEVPLTVIGEVRPAGTEPAAHSAPDSGHDHFAR